MTFLVNMMFRRLDKFDGPIFGGWLEGAGVRIYGGLIFGMLIGLHVWGHIYIRGGVLTGFYGIELCLDL